MPLRRYNQLLNEKDQGADPKIQMNTYLKYLLDAKRGQLVLFAGQCKAAHHRQAIDDAMVAIEKDNRSIKGVLLKDYARPLAASWTPAISGISKNPDSPTVQ
jgi:hypothetical protein